jgi:hypothetical protein
MRLRKSAIPIFLVITLSGCATATGTSYTASSASRLLDSSEARIVVFKEIPGGNRVFVNGSQQSDLKGDGFLILSTKSSQLVLTVDAGTGTIGECRLSKPVEPSKTYYFEVLQNKSYAAASLFGFLGQAIYSSRGDCGGPYELKEIQPEQAVPRLEKLKNSAG